ncbi:AbrB/MazE/SpoVT family DNA-binding domain-containing protein [Desulfallas sp. Bu1-1]|jgi:AbrB family looped-hinge helix DNA binding protein|uniref:AbrB/MazE/SpoVT family DNA-binding domain-containing protein n=1 Tax=Desulfallas sp. Bu1-1 TaxID=2787620 RepID=UPI0018A083CF|nr:AbrB/MazE/SpoVT family DNA-binding domain-containing protein [Desulfallas sp. Bu1-1]MBF7084423.1 AbrB/MazE/SpoVT family DNA-binding domain-containing protein [Desulfallas sp. Bu1-1]
MLVELKQKSQVTIPSELVKKMNLRPGDKLEIEEKDGRIIITPVVVIPRDQMWFYSKEWQQGEARVDKDIKEGKIKTASSKEELFNGLGLDE